MQSFLDFLTPEHTERIFLSIGIFFSAGLVVLLLAMLAVSVVRDALGKPDPNRQCRCQDGRKKMKTEKREMYNERD